MLILIIFYDLRAPVYDEVAGRLSGIAKKALGNLQCPEDFGRYLPPHSFNIEFKDREGFELRTLIVGEIAGSAHATVLRATGNYYTPADFKPIDDSKTSVKDVLALVVPTCATTKMINYFHNQTIPLREAIDVETNIEQAAGEEFLTRPWLRSVDESGEDEIIIPATAGHPGTPVSTQSTPVRRAKRRLDDETPLASSPVVDRAKLDQQIKEDKKKVKKPGPSEIKLGAFYDPRLLSDYGGPYFNHVKSKLVQLDVRDGTATGGDALIPAWKFYERLKPGTLVLVQASLHIFVMADTDFKSGMDVRGNASRHAQFLTLSQIYQINAHNVKVLADSDAPVEHRAILIPRGYEGSGAQFPASQEFMNFKLSGVTEPAEAEQSAPLMTTFRWYWNPTLVRPLRMAIRRLERQFLPLSRDLPFLTVDLRGRIKGVLKNEFSYWSHLKRLAHPGFFSTMSSSSKYCYLCTIISRRISIVFSVCGVMVDGEIVIPEDVIRRVAAGVTVAVPAAQFPELSPVVYGGGQTRGTYRGFEFIEASVYLCHHGGTVPGFKSQITRIPNQNFGVAVLSNHESFGFQIAEAVKFRIVDEVLDLEVIDWSARFKSLITAQFNERPIPTPRSPSPTLPSIAFSALAGTYRDPGYGILELCFISPESLIASASESCRQLIDEIPTTVAFRSIRWPVTCDT
ncbi:hypothetical protein B0H14DRAFT_2634424 [Mycena olivaceomarginata]|nr:hypothetical protein B0H14DRAFT_2634424 [Mycena olivaceomarginata]